MDTATGKRSGWLFVFEGIDGSGKSTQMRRVAAVLRERGHDVVELFEPTNGPFGRRIRESVRQGAQRASAEQETEWFIRDRRENVAAHLRPALEEGAIVLLDRYYFSTMAYQGARGLDPDEIQRRNEAFAPRPDAVFYFAIDVDTAMERIERARGTATDLFERRECLERVKAIYDDLAARLNFVHTIDAGADEDTVTRDVLAAIDNCLAQT